MLPLSHTGTVAYRVLTGLAAVALTQCFPARRLRFDPPEPPSLLQYPRARPGSDRGSLKSVNDGLEKKRTSPSFATIARLCQGEGLAHWSEDIKEWCHELCNATRYLGRDAAPAGRDQPPVRQRPR